MSIAGRGANNVSIALRTQITGVVSSNITLIFEVEASIDGSTGLDTITRNSTITGYISPNDALVTFTGLMRENYYVFRSRVFNIYGASEYSLSSARIFISGKCC